MTTLVTESPARKMDVSFHQGRFWGDLKKSAARMVEDGKGLVQDSTVSWLRSSLGVSCSLGIIASPKSPWILFNPGQPLLLTDLTLPTVLSHSYLLPQDLSLLGQESFFMNQRPTDRVLFLRRISLPSLPISNRLKPGSMGYLTSLWMRTWM
ncbi:hypothetical protein K435DRAFT_863260 [Dendrothele bispora CBS 962.96]|uniref:Uncharacterized protein n=1 Tax=Dendrothele bispora (strain CBS 962.96) TaxID=1314807 RepID=A0A4S8LQ94_DENBC|nr:hypothetical protein K435DRAFT_863260 [Dendrothele bispora CBS 962.96]